MFRTRNVTTIFGDKIERVYSNTCSVFQMHAGTVKAQLRYDV